MGIRRSTMSWIFLIAILFGGEGIFGQDNSQFFTTKGNSNEHLLYDASSWREFLEMSQDTGIVRWEESFDSTFPPPDSIWRIIDNDGSGSGWEYRSRVDFISGFSVLPNQGTYFLFSRFNRANAQGIIDEWIISPRLPQINSDDYLYIHAGAVDDQFPDSLYIYLAENGNDISDFNNEIAALQVKGPGGAWNRYRFPLESFAGQSPYVGVNYYHEDGGPGRPNSDNVWVDHFILGKLPDIVLSNSNLQFQPDSVVVMMDTVAIDTFYLADTLSFTLANLGPDTIDVFSIASSQAQFLPDTTRLKLSPFDQETLSIYYQPDSLNPAFAATLTIENTDIVNNLIEIPLTVAGHTITAIAPGELPESFQLGQNYPNPFNPTTRIDYELTVPGEVRLDVFNVLGQKIRTLVRGNLPPGNYSATWDSNDQLGRPVASGVYIYRLQTGRAVEAKKMILLR